MALICFRGAVGGLLCARGRRASGCGRSGGPASRDRWISLLKQSTTRNKFACFASVSWDTPRRVGHTPQIERRILTKKSRNDSCRTYALPKLNEEIARKSKKMLLVEFDSFENDCLKIHFSTNQMQIKLNEKKKKNDMKIK